MYDVRVSCKLYMRWAGMKLQSEENKNTATLYVWLALALHRICMRSARCCLSLSLSLYTLFFMIVWLDAIRGFSCISTIFLHSFLSFVSVPCTVLIHSHSLLAAIHMFARLLLPRQTAYIYSERELLDTRAFHTHCFHFIHKSVYFAASSCFVHTPRHTHITLTSM